MIFPLERGELPNVLQFLSMAGRTGELEIKEGEGGDPRRGYIHLRHGKIYFAIIEQSDGLEALAEMTNLGNVEAIFTPDVAVEERNIDLPMANLLVQVVVRADELAAEAGQESAIRVRTAAEEEPDRPQTVVNRSPKRVILSATGAKFSHLLRVVGKLLFAVVIFAMVFGAGSLVHLKMQDLRQRRQLTAHRERAEEAAAEEVRQRKIKASRILRDAQQAHGEKAYEQAEAAARRVLDLDEGNQAARELLKEIKATQTFIAAAPLKGEAESTYETLTQLPQGQGIREAVDLVEGNIRSAGTLFEAREYEAAAAAYRAALAAAERVVGLDEARTRARTMRDEELAPVKQRAEEAAAAAKARPLWRSGEGLEAAGDRAFERGKFDEAVRTWQAATVQYEKATFNVNKRQVMLAARDAYMNRHRGLDVGVLRQYAPGEWARVEAVAEAAEALAESEKLEDSAAQWEAATKLLGTVAEQAIMLRRAADYEAAMREGKLAIEGQHWDEAEAHFSAALDVTGYADDDPARTALRQSRLEKRLAGAEEARRKGAWQEAETLARKALGIDGENERGRDLLALAEENLVPRLTIYAETDGRPVKDAEVVINGDQAHPLVAPVTIPLTLGETYEIRVSRQPADNHFYQAFDLEYLVKHPGRQSMTAILPEIGAPAARETAVVPGTEIALAPIPAGDFTMGSVRRREELPVHQVTFAKPFWMATHEVTNADYRIFVAASGYDGGSDANSSYLRHFKGRADVPADDALPVCYISWKNAVAFCNWLTKRENQGGRLPEGYVYRLPTEAEWEYACRAGTRSDYAGQLDQMAWYAKNTRTLRPAGTRLGNPWGLRDMHGSLWEFCHDLYGPYPADGGAATDPAGPDTGVFRVARGGSWTTTAELCRSSYRGSAARTDTKPNLGFRIVLAPALP